MTVGCLWEHDIHVGDGSLFVEISSEPFGKSTEEHDRHVSYDSWSQGRGWKQDFSNFQY